MTRQFIAQALAGTAFTLLATSGALALDADDFTHRVTDALKVMGIGLTVGTSRVEGDTITLSGFTFSVSGKTSEEVEGEVTFEGVSETGDGGYSAQSARIADIEFADEEMAFALRNLVAEGITIPANLTPETAVEISYRLVDRVSAGPVTIDTEGAQAFSIDLIEYWTDVNPDMTVLTSGFALSGITLNLGMVPDPEAIEVFEAFGIEQMVASFSGQGTWQPDEGRVALDELLFDFENLGAINLTGVFSGYTRAFSQDLMKANLKMAELGEDATPEQIAEIEDAVFVKMMELEIESVSLRYDDASLFTKTLDFIGAEQGIDGATFASGLKFMVPMMLTELQNPDFAAMATSAVNAFIDNPESFEIAIAPDQPVGFATIEALEDEPAALIELLNLQLRANQ